MSNQNTFDQLKRSHIRTLEQYVPIVDRVHGSNHPEFHDVRSIFDTIVGKIQDAGDKQPELHADFTRLREITDTYRVPSDVCESYEAVYHMLGEIDEAYHAQS